MILSPRARPRRSMDFANLGYVDLRRTGPELPEVHGRQPLHSVLTNFLAADTAVIY